MAEICFHDVQGNERAGRLPHGEAVEANIMSMRTFTCFVTVKGKEDRSLWTEEYTVDCDDPRAYAEGLCTRFNATKHPHEAERIIRSVRHDRLARYAEHVWCKTNLMTISKGGQMYDTAECQVCHITGKRFGLSSTVIRDKKFSAPKWVKCDLLPLRPRQKLPAK